MKFCLAVLLVINASFYHLPAPSPLSDYSSAWNEAQYLKCNTASKVGYMSAAEKEVIYVLNLARMNPVLFANTVIRKYPEKTRLGYLVNSTYYTSLLDTMLALQPMELLYPDSLSYAGAYCHAVNSGKEGYVGHTRSSEDCLKKKHFRAECCDYGHERPLDIIMSLLIDEGVTSLGHRYVCLGSYNRIGVSIQPHRGYIYNTVLDFYY